MAKTKAKKKRKKWAISGANEVRRTSFDGMPIVDAVADFTLVVRTADVKAAEGNQRNAANCILAKACQAQVGASTVAIFRRTAYLDLPDAKGERRVVRFILDKGAAAIVSAFDRGRSVKGEVTVTLRAPTPSQTLDDARERTRRRTAAILRGEIVPGNNASGFHKKPTISRMDVRNGTGLVHNALKKAKESQAAGS